VIELRRLCEVLRNHLQSIPKYAHQAYAINLNAPESMQMHLTTRFMQLNAAAQLELWQEAFRSVEGNDYIVNSFFYLLQIC
jgi:translation initiation factor 3 subunit A